MSEFDVDPPKSPLQLGIWTAALTLPIHLLLSASSSYIFAALTLCATAGLYMGAAMSVPVDSEGKQNGLPLVKETGVGLVLFVLAFFGATGMPYLIPLAYLLHGIRDTYHDRFFSDTPIVSWYPTTCATFDFLFAIGLVLIWQFWMV